MKPDIIIPAQPKPIEVPLSLRAASKLIERHKGEEQDDILDMMLRGADSLTADVELIPVACERIMANKMQSELKNASAARRRVGEIAHKATAKLDADRDRAERAIAKLESAVLPSPPQDMLGVIAELKQIEVRSALRSMKSDERLKVLHDAVEAGDEVFAGAVINAPHHLTGLGPAELGMVTHEWKRKWHGQTLERIARLRASLGELDRLSGLLQTWASGIFHAQDANLSAAEQSERLARAAMSADVA